MKKLLNPSDKILISLAFLGDLAIEVYARGNGFGWKKSIFESLDIKNSTFRSCLFRSLKVGEIEKVIDKSGKPCFKLGSSGRNKIERLFPLFKLSKKPWDGKWRVVIFDIAEKERLVRDLLRIKLVSLGFGKIQESVYIAPLDVLVDIKEFLKAQNLYGKVIVFEAREVFGSDPKIIANYLWHLDDLNKKYQIMLDEADYLKNNDSNLQEKMRLKNQFFEVLLKDPILPKEFLPVNWVGEETRKAVMSLV